MILSSLGLKKTRIPVAKLVLIVEATLLAISFVWIFLRRIPVFENIKFDKGSIILGILMGGVVLASSGLFYLIDKFAFNLKMREMIEKMIYPIFSKVSFPDIIMMAVMSGIAEEVFFRGILMKEFGIIAASLIFGALHTSSKDTWFMGFWSALAGVFFCILYIKTGNLLVPIIAHAVNNFVGVMYIRYIYTQPEKAETSTLTQEEIDQEVRKENRAGFDEQEEIYEDDEMSISPVISEGSFQEVTENTEGAETPELMKIMPVMEETPAMTVPAHESASESEEAKQTTPLPAVSSPVQLLNPDMLKDIIRQPHTETPNPENQPESSENMKESEPPVFENLLPKKEEVSTDKQNENSDKKKKKKKKQDIKPEHRADDINEEGIGFVHDPQ
ncbi:MAG: CPBP family glutamic-type intramembrane protease [Firmicutes bacterium]|nr:CPBP family glutamic-type intramembrane protease [Bacillota bacterium]